MRLRFYPHWCGPPVNLTVTHPMNSASPEELKVLQEDLEYLVKTWPKGEISDAELRRSSAVLRRLFSHDDLNRAWVTVVGKKDFLVPSSFIYVADSNRLTEVNFATSSQVQNVGMKIFNVIEFNKIQEGPEPIYIKDEVAVLKRYLKQPACVISGVLISREDIVKFVANKCGGAHFDSNHIKPIELAIAAMKQYFIGNRQALFHEMLSYGQVLASAESTNELIAALGSW